MLEYRWRVTYRCDRAVLGCETFDQRFAMCIFCQIPKRAVAAGVKDRVEIIGRNRVELDCICQFTLCRFIRFEPLGIFGLRIFCVAGWVQRGLPALRRGKRNVGPSVLKNVIGCGKFFEPKTGFVARVA